MENETNDLCFFSCRRGRLLSSFLIGCWVASVLHHRLVVPIGAVYFSRVFFFAASGRCKYSLIVAPRSNRVEPLPKIAVILEWRVFFYLPPPAPFSGDRYLFFSLPSFALISSLALRASSVSANGSSFTRLEQSFTCSCFPRFFSLFHLPSSGVFFSFGSSLDSLWLRSVEARRRRRSLLFLRHCAAVSVSHSSSPRPSPTSRFDSPQKSKQSKRNKKTPTCSSFHHRLIGFCGRIGSRHSSTRGRLQFPIRFRETPREKRKRKDAI